MTKLELFNRDLQEISAFFKALSHPARLSILEYLAETGVCISGDISHELPLSRTTVNQHLKELKALGLVKGKITGKHVNYCLNPETVRQYHVMVQAWIEKISNSPTNIC